MHSVNTRPSSRRRASVTAALVASLMALAAGCGSDSPSTSPTAPATTVPDTTLPATTVAPTTPETVAVTVAETVAATVADTASGDDGAISDLGADMIAAPEYTEYVKLTDDSGVITMEVPAEWTDIKTSPIDNAGTLYPTIAASMDLVGFENSFDVPGVRFMSTPIPISNLDTVLGIFAVEDCVAGEVTAYDDGVFSGKFQIWSECGGTATVNLVLVTNLANDGFTTFVTTVQAVTTADLAALDRILKSFNTVA